ncbi:vesicular glutamate transporter 2-like isoform X2 [Planococcus citri]|uniref:vesicular glutamate transporter 2-like isoform X2 n=1 Tax=Planococcus citri TaxID=170843 RepID=UPI0031FA106F
MRFAKMKISEFKIPKRYIIVTMVFIGYANMFYLHSNLGMAVVEMTSVKNINLQNGTIDKRADFNWSSHQKGIILSSFSYGRLFSPIGGLLAGKFGGSTIYSIGILVTSLVTFFTPVFLNIHFNVFVITNVILGAFEAFSYASVTQIFSRWAPPDERAKFVSFSVVGANLGSGISFIISGWILSFSNWEALFYISGAASFAWYWIWIFVVKNDPSEDNRMNEQEKNFIKETINCDYNNEKIAYPWKKILTCMPFWVACLIKFSIGSYQTITYLYVPQYLKDTNNIDIKKIGFISMIPQICAVISAPLSGLIGDYIRSHKLLSITNIHKLFMSIGTFSSVLGLMSLVLWSNLTAAIVALSVIQFCGTFTITSVLILFLDFTPKYASFLNSVANVFYTGSLILTPILFGFIVTSQSLYQWNICFVTLSCECLIIGILYLIFGSGEQRSWANYNPKKKDPIEQSKEENS